MADKRRRALDSYPKKASHWLTFLKVEMVPRGAVLIIFFVLVFIIFEQHKLVSALEKQNRLELEIVTVEHRIEGFRATSNEDALAPLQKSLSELYQKINDNFSLIIGSSYTPSVLTDDDFRRKHVNLTSESAHGTVEDTLLLIYTLVNSSPEKASSLINSGFSLVPMINAMQLEESELVLELSATKSQLILVAVFALITLIFHFALLHRTRNATNQKHDLTNYSTTQQETYEDDHTAQEKELLRLISHEFRAPISVIISALELIPNMESQRNKLIQQAEQSSYRLLSLTNNLTELLAVNIDDDLQLQRVDLISLLDECISPYSVQTKDKKVDLEMHCSHSVPNFVKSDPNAIAKVITNILDNAVKFTSSGLIDVSFTTLVNNKRIFFVAVIRDTGTGIDEETQQKMFDRFYKGNNTKSKRFPGAGIGLSVAKRALDMLGGTSNVKSSEGLGTEFEVFIPITPLEDDLTAVSVTSTAKFAIVDDLEISRLHIQSILTSQGYSSRTFSSGAELLNLHDDVLQFTAIIADLYMPGMTGLELIETLHAIYKNRMPPIIVLSATPDIANIVANNSANIYQSFVKPIDKYRFIDTLNSLAANRATAVVQAKKAHILVVEDEPINAEMVEYMLNGMGHSVVVCHSGDDAILHTNESTFDCVLLDINLPDIYGLEVAKIVKERHPNLPIIALTANSHRNDKEASLQAGIRYHLVKPITFQELKNTLKLTL